MLWKATSVWGSAAVSWVAFGGERRRLGRARLPSLSPPPPAAAEASEDESLVCGTCIKGSPERNFLALPLALVIREYPRASGAAAAPVVRVVCGKPRRRCYLVVLSRFTRASGARGAAPCYSVPLRRDQLTFDNRGGGSLPAHPTPLATRPDSVRPMFRTAVLR